MGCFNCGFGDLTVSMNGRRIPKRIREKGEHRIENPLINGSGGCVIKIYHVNNYPTGNIEQYKPARLYTCSRSQLLSTLQSFIIGFLWVYTTLSQLN
jgi:hypothetical protein